MYLTHISLTNFRNFTRLDVDVPGGALLLVGSNAQGKTSLLEAIYFLAAFVSFHASSDRELINFLAAREPLAVTRILADYQQGQLSHRLEVRVIQENEGINGATRVRKEVLLDGVKRRTGEALGAFNAVLFLPQMLRIVDGSPDERRRFMNLAISQIDPRYAATLLEFNHVLNQRNALLKQLNERGGDPDEMSFWDEQLAANGAVLILSRVKALQELERLAVRFHQELTRSQEVLRIHYQPSYDPLQPPPGGARSGARGKPPKQIRLPMQTPIDRSGLSLEKIQQGYLSCLGDLRKEDIQRGMTSTGPQRDEFRFLANGMDLGTYGSRGQARTAILSLKLAEVEWMKGKTGEWPVLLLDEVLAELDIERRDDLLGRISSSEQALMTTTDLDLFDRKFVDQATIWHVRAGRLEMVKDG